MAIQDDKLLIREADNIQFQIIKSWGKMKWDKQTQTLSGILEIELLNKLASLVTLPENIKLIREKLNNVIMAVNKERLNPEPKPLIVPLIKTKLYKHQIRGYNMALMTLGLVEPLN